MKENGIVGNFMWKFLERISAQLVTLGVTIILARILEPSHYGIISIVTIFITLANVFVSDGLGTALIQKKNADELDFSSVLIVNTGLSILLYFILFMAAPAIASFYGEEYGVLVPVLRVLGIRIIISAINSVQHAYVSRKMMFRMFFWATLFGTLVSAVVGITMAVMGFGVWALVAQYLTNTITDTIVLQFIIKRIPKFRFSSLRMKGLLSFGFSILGSRLLITGYQELRALLIGKIYSSTDLAFYDKAKQFPNLLVANIDASIGAVLFPKMSSFQDDRERIKELTRMSVRISSFIMCPIMFGLAAVATTFVSVILTDKWLPIVPYVRMFCFVFMFQPIHTANLQAIKAMGESQIFFKLELIKKTIELLVLLITVRISVSAIVIGMVLCTIVFTFLNAYPNKKLLNYSIGEQFKDLFPNFVSSVVIFGVVYWLDSFMDSSIVNLIFQIIVGGLLYLLISILTKNREFRYIVTTVVNTRNQKG